MNRSCRCPSQTRASLFKKKAPLINLTAILSPGKTNEAFKRARPSDPTQNQTGGCPKRAFAQSIGIARGQGKNLGCGK